ncbi:MAG: DUF4469 domain-containing protein [Spirochaetaceae bacterium]|jgi:hypothetical protein|nr:DUF4469 domain-containing protein [Spirochaetaceae bacterium]
MKRFFWKVWLRSNPLTKDVENDYLAEVSTIGRTLRNEDIAQAIKEGGSELHEETLLDILNRADALRRQKIQEGCSVQTGVCHIAPRILGNWIGSSAKFDETQHKTSCDMTPSAELRTALTEVGVEVLGVKENVAFIGLVTDAATGKTDGTVTPNEDLIIEGERIKIAPEDEAGLGAFFVSSSGGETPVSHRLVQNSPKKLIIRVPALTAGTYTLVIKTRFSMGKVIIKEPRIITYDQKITVK